jgi:hypothetical protein
MREGTRTCDAVTGCATALRGGNGSSVSDALCRVNAGGFHAGFVIHLRELSVVEDRKDEDEEDEDEVGAVVGEGREELR